MKTRILIVGASGLVGGALMAEFAGVGEVVGTFHRFAAEGLHPLDVTDALAVAACVGRRAPRVVLQPASLTNVDFCETHPAEAWRINVEGTRHLAAAAAQVGAVHVFFSSDYVFEGTAGPYSEDDPPNPQSVYGRSKWAAEQVIRELNPDHLIVRTTVVYGWEQQGKNFVIRLLRSLDQGQEVRVPRDQVGSPTYAPDLARAVRELVQKSCRGIYNLAGGELVGRYDFALAAARTFGLRSDLIRPVATNDLDQPAPRPLQGGLKVDKALSLLEAPLLGYQEGLETMRKELRG